MSNPDFVYTTYIKSTPQKVWNAIVTPEFTRQYWKVELHSDWKKGSRWTSKSADMPTIAGGILESDPPRRLVISWADCDAPQKGATSRVSFDIEPAGDMVRLTVIHADLDDGVAARVSKGWPRVLSSMKSFLETGTALDTWAA
jgi:uncharacterized protein YndB with AHSA1/START domain